MEGFQPAHGRFGMEGNPVVNFRNGCGCHTRFSLAGYFPRRRSAFLWRHSPNQTRPLSTRNQPSHSSWFSFWFLLYATLPAPLEQRHRWPLHARSVVLVTTISAWSTPVPAFTFVLVFMASLLSSFRMRAQE